MLIAASTRAIAQKLDTLTIEKIMRDPKWIGISPSGIRWSDDSKTIYFKWNPENTDRDQLYSITPTDVKPVKVAIGDQKMLPPAYGHWNKNMR